MGMEEVRIPVGEGAVTASVHGAGPTVVILGHGAGSNRRHPRLLELAEALSASGRRTVLYNFPYTDRGGRAPDPAPVLESTTRAVGEYARGGLRAARLGHGGRAMGGRIASQAGAAGAPPDGLGFLPSPPHPPGRPEVRREGPPPRNPAARALC